MDTAKFEKRNTRVIAHRGISGIEAENTNSAFVAAGNRSYYGIETDIHRTADGRFVAVHDGNLSRVAGVDLEIEHSTLAEIQRITLIDKDGSKNRMDLHVGTLENYISICKKYKKHCVLELKSQFTNDEIKDIIDTTKQYDYLNNITFISFDYDNLLKIRKISPKQSAQFLFYDITEDILNHLAADKLDADVYYGALTKQIIIKMHKLSIKVNCWTVDDKATAEKLSAWGVDFITSNILE